MSKRHGCECPKCCALCTHEPGWFISEEIPLAAEFCGLTEAAFRSRYLEAHEQEDATLWSPRRAKGGHCVFLTSAENNQARRAVEGEAPPGFAGRRGRREPHNKDGKCRIHPVKPFECRKVFGCESDRRHRRVREQMVRVVKTFGVK